MLPKISVPTSAEPIRPIAKRFQGVTTCSVPSTNMPSLLGLKLCTSPGELKTFRFCLTVCWSVKLLNDAACANDFNQLSLEYGDNFHVIG